MYDLKMQTLTTFQAEKKTMKKIQGSSKEISKCKKCSTTSLLVQTQCKLKKKLWRHFPVMLRVQPLLYLDQWHLRNGEGRKGK